MVEGNKIEIPAKHARFNLFFSKAFFQQKIGEPRYHKKMFFSYHQEHDYGRRMLVPHEGLLVFSRKRFSHELYSIAHLFNLL